MPFLEEAKKQINTQYENLNTAKTIIENVDREKLYDVFHQAQGKDIKLESYIKDTRPILKGISELLNSKLAETSFYIEKDPMIRNSNRLTIKHKENHWMGEIYLSDKSIYMRANPYSKFMGNQKQIRSLETIIPEQKERIERYTSDMEKYEKYPCFVKKMKGLSDKKMEQLLDFLEDEKKRFGENQEEYNELTSSRDKEWDKTLFYLKEIKSFYQIMDEYGFKVNSSLFKENKTYYVRYREETNHHFSGVLTYEEEHMSFISKDEWELDYINEQYGKKFSYTKDEFIHLYNSLKAEKSISKVKNEVLSEKDCISVEMDKGKISISKNGIIVCNGIHFNLYHLLRFPKIREALCPLYKKRTKEDFLDETTKH